MTRKPQEKVTIRLLPEKAHIYAEFKELVTKQMGSSTCFVMTNLMEVWVQAMKNLPSAEKQQLEMNFMRQNVQINIGNNIIYAPKKGRRYPPIPPTETQLNKNTFFPLLLEQWPTMKEENKAFWKARLEEAGIIPPSISTPQTKTTIKKIYGSMKQSMTIAGRWLRKLLGHKDVRSKKKG